MKLVKKLSGIKAWPEEDRPREKLFREGEHKLTDTELLAILLRTGRRGESALDLARKILREFRSFRNMANLDLKQWKKLKGLGMAKIAQIKAAIEIGRRFGEEKIRGKKIQIKSAHDVYEVLYPRLRDLKKEVFKVLLLDSRNRIIDIIEVEEGTYDMTANKQFYSGDNATVTVDLANLNVEQNFTLGQEMINVTIHVNGFDGASEYDLDNATVELTGDSGTYSGTTDATGNVTFEIPSGVYDWTASHDGYDTGGKTGIGFYSGNTYDEITLNKHGEIIGTVMSWTDTAIADALVKVYDADTTTVEGTDITDTSGDYTVGDLSAGNYDVKVLKGGCVPVMKENKNVAIGGTTTVNFKVSCQ